MVEHERENHQGLGVFMNREIFGMVVMKQHIMIEECKHQNHQALEVFMNAEIYRVPVVMLFVLAKEVLFCGSLSVAVKFGRWRYFAVYYLFR